MMIDTVIEILKESGAEAWEIHDTHTDGLEFYFIRHELDQNRAKKVEHLNVTVYVRVKEGTYGIATGEIYPTCTEQEIRETVEGLCENARYAENRAYRLNQKKPVQTENVSFDVYANARAFIDTLQSVHETYTEFINSYEVFTGVSTDRFLNSEGVDVTETYPESMAEVIINARNAEHEIELYRMYRSGTCDAESMKKDHAVRQGPSAGNQYAGSSGCSGTSFRQRCSKSLSLSSIPSRYRLYLSGTFQCRDRG